MHEKMEVFGEEGFLENLEEDAVNVLDRETVVEFVAIFLKNSIEVGFLGDEFLTESVSDEFFPVDEVDSLFHRFFEVAGE